MEVKSEKLMEIGVDVSSVVRRLGGNELLYLTICSKFAKDPNYRILRESLSSNDYKSAELRVHTLKGVAANLGFVQLEMISNSLLQDIREKELATLRQNIYCLSEEYHRIISVLTDNK